MSSGEFNNYYEREVRETYEIEERNTVTIKARGIDHLVVCVEDIDQAVARWQSYGFVTTPVARHPWGTVNSLVQFDGNFVELLAIGESGAITEHSTETFSFGAWNRDWLKNGEGLSMLVFEGKDSRADVEEFRQSEIKTFAPFDFERPAQLPDGSVVTVGFSLAFALNEQMPRAAFFTCHQHAPEYFWKADYQAHSNAGTQIVDVTMVDQTPLRHQAFFDKLQGAGSAIENGENLLVKTARGVVQVISPATWAARYPGVSVDVSDGAVFGAMQVAATDLNYLPSSFKARPDGRVWIDTGGLVLEFVTVT